MQPQAGIAPSVHPTLGCDFLRAGRARGSAAAGRLPRSAEVAALEEEDKPRVSKKRAMSVAPSAMRSGSMAPTARGSVVRELSARIRRM